MLYSVLVEYEITARACDGSVLKTAYKRHVLCPLSKPRPEGCFYVTNEPLVTELEAISSGLPII